MDIFLYLEPGETGEHIHVPFTKIDHCPFDTTKLVFPFFFFCFLSLHLTITHVFPHSLTRVHFHTSLKIPRDTFQLFTIFDAYFLGFPAPVTHFCFLFFFFKNKMADAAASCSTTTASKAGSVLMPVSAHTPGLRSQREKTTKCMQELMRMVLRKSPKQILQLSQVLRRLPTPSNYSFYLSIVCYLRHCIGNQHMGKM